MQLNTPKQVSVTDAIHYALHSVDMLGTVGLYVNNKPKGTEQSKHETYGIVELSGREYTRTLRRISDLSRCTFNIRLYSNKDGRLAEIENILITVLNTIRKVRFERFLVISAILIGEVSDSKDEQPEKDQKYKYQKTISIAADIRETPYEKTGT